MLSNPIRALAVVGTLFASGLAFGGITPVAAAGNTASCCSDDCCEGCPDCDCTCDCCDNCADGCDCTCNS